MSEDILGKLVAEKYRVENLIGESDMGDLYAGRNEIVDKPVTVKILPLALSVDQRWTKRFIDESRAAATVSHPNILNLTDFGNDAKGTAYAVFEPIAGKQLSEITSEPLKEDRAIAIATQIAAAVSAAHEKKLVHGRLSPDCVIVETDETGADSVKVYGFGGDPMSVSRDADPHYLAPEQCNSFPVADERSDVYSLAVMIYEMLSGVLPFEGKTPAEILERSSSEPPPPLSAFRKDLNPEIEPIILTAMSANAERRYQTMAAFAEDLNLLSSRIAPAKTTAAAANGRSIWKTSVVALVGVSVLAVALIYATSVRKTDPTTQLQADAGSFPVQPIGPATGAQEESLARLPAMTDAEILATSQQPISDLPGGDGYNAWANGGAPPTGAPPLGAVIPMAGAPLNQGGPPIEYIQPGGQTYTVPSAGSGSQFMPAEGGVILVPVPVNPETAPTANPSPSPKASEKVPTGQPTVTDTGKKTFVKPTDAKPADGKSKTKTPTGKSTKKADKPEEGDVQGQ
ncbi:MAG: protein kinase [Pyrinomonadaceae bacterium]